MPVRNYTALIETHNELNEQAGGQDPPEDHRLAFSAPHGNGAPLKGGGKLVTRVRVPVDITSEKAHSGETNGCSRANNKLQKHFATFLGFPFSGVSLFSRIFRPIQKPSKPPFCSFIVTLYHKLLKKSMVTLRWCQPQ